MSWKHCQFNAKVWCTAKILLQNCLCFQLVAFPFSSRGKDSCSLSQHKPECNMHKQVLPLPQAGVRVKAVLAIWKRKIFHTLILFLKCFSLPVDSGKDTQPEGRIGLLLHVIWEKRWQQNWELVLQSIYYFYCSWVYQVSVFQFVQLRNGTNEFVPCMKEFLDCTNEKLLMWEFYTWKTELNT